MIGNNFKNKGFTLIELVIALAVFSLLIVMVTGLGLFLIRAQRKALAIQQVQESARYLLESISKEITMSLVNTGTGLSKSIDIDGPKGSVNYEFKDIDKKLYRTVGAGGEQVISPSDVDIEGNFYIKGGASPRWLVVTIVMKILSKDSGEGQGSAIYLQTTAVPRRHY